MPIQLSTFTYPKEVHFMNILKLIAASTLFALFLTACGGGNGGSTGGGTTGVTPNTTIDTVVTGMASKGPVTGTISFYILDNSGRKGSLLKSAAISKGSYSSINIGKYAGPILIEVIGSYTDEATGSIKYITADAPMRAALSNAAGTTTVQVTPLTELAVQKAGALTASNIVAGNKLISDIFKFDIITTQPLDPSKAALSGSLVTQSQKDYTLALAALSQLSSTRRDLLFSNTLASVANGISYSGVDSQTIASFQEAVSDTKIKNTNFADVSSTNLTKINGGTTATYKLVIMGNFSSNAIKGIQFDVVIPSGLTVRYDAASGNLFQGVLTAAPSVNISQDGGMPARYSAADGVLYLIFLPNAGIGAGDLATITCDILPGWTVPAASAFSVRNIKAVDGSTPTATINGVNVTVK
jgi:hypothetical protein